jgi:hypothetical protein
MMNKVLLMAGIAAVVVYVIGDLLSSLSRSESVFSASLAGKASRGLAAS